MTTDLYLLAIFIALLIGILIGKGWERYKLRDGSWTDRRRLGETPHYLLGLIFLVDNQIDQATDELTKASKLHPDAFDIQIVLGNLLREKGQVGKAIHIHEALLQRPKITTLEHACVLLCLGLDFRHGGFVDRASETFQEVVQLDPKNRYALLHLQKLHEEQHQWDEALNTRRKISEIETDQHSEDSRILAFLKNEIGASQAKVGELISAASSFESAIDVNIATTPAYLNLGDVRKQQDRLGDAVVAWERLIDTSPERAYLAFDRLVHAYRTLGTENKFTDLCNRLIDANPQDWRARLSLARYFSAGGQPQRAFGLLLEALPHNPHGLALHRDIWQLLLGLGLEVALVKKYLESSQESLFYLDPHVCVRCHYRSTELLWQCPQCHEWGTFVEERLSPGKDPETSNEAVNDPEKPTKNSVVS